MKTIGIVCNDYKLEKFRAALREKNYSFTETPMTGIPALKDHTLIKILCLPQEFETYVGEIARICKKLEIDFKRSN